MTLRERRHACLVVLLRDYGYRYTGDTLIRTGPDLGWSSPVIGRFRSIWAAAEHLLPMDDEYRRRLDRIEKMDEAENARIEAMLAG